MGTTNLKKITAFIPTIVGLILRSLLRIKYVFNLKPHLLAAGQFIALISISASLTAAPLSKGTNPSKKKITKASISYISEMPEACVIEKMPRKAETIEIDEQKYRYYNGLFYKLNGEVYENTKAPIGVVVNAIPDDYQRIIMSGKVYYFSTGVFYVQKGKKDFATVYGPIGGQVSKLPEGTQPIKIEGRNYYLFQDVVFKKGASRTRNYYELYGYVED